MADNHAGLKELLDDVRNPKPKGEKKSKAAILLRLAEQASLFRSDKGVTYADVIAGNGKNSHRETWPINSTGFRRWLTRVFYIETKGAPNAEDIKSTTNVLDAKASVEGIERPIHVRVGHHDGKIYVDLCNDKWQAVMIDADGWQVVDRPSVRFRRVAGMLPLPIPEHGGSIEELRAFLNVRSKGADATDSDFVLAVAWLLGTLSTGPFPLFVVMGEHDSAKTVTCKSLVKLIDPNVRDLGTLPREDRDLFISAGNRHILGYENVSYIPPWLSDSLCMIATGGGHGTRALWFDDEEAIFQAKRPVILNSIENVITRADHADRGIFLLLDSMTNKKRRSEDEMNDAFEKARPCIMGAVFDAVAHGLKHLPSVQSDELPRMADFAKWVIACEGAMWEPGTFIAAYTTNRDEAAATMVKADPVADAVRKLMQGGDGEPPLKEWSGTATDLLARLNVVAGKRIAKSKSWPTTPSTLSNRLRRGAQPLRMQGINVNQGDRDGHDRIRMIHITNAAEPSPIE